MPAALYLAGFYETAEENSLGCGADDHCIGH